MKVTILGSGGSNGVPQIGNDWGACDPTNPKNRRSRCGVLLQRDGFNVVFDTSQDFREQILRQGLRKIDAAFYTHHHADHSSGIYDLKTLFYVNNGTPVSVYAASETMELLHHRYPHAFADAHHHSQVKALVPHVLQGPVEVGPFHISYFKQNHGAINTLGYRVGDFAFSTDVKALDDAAFEALAGVKVWVVDCNGATEAFTHSHFEQTLDWIARVKPARAILTHMNQTLDYEATKAKCPAGVEPAYDGMVIDIP